MKRLGNSESNMLVKEWIFTSLMILMEKKEFQKITITDITNKAGVSRMAFYRNYSVKEDIITDYLDKLFQMYLAELSEYTQIDVYQFAYKFFAYFRKHRKLIQNLNKAELSVLLLKRFDLYLNSIFEDIFHSSFEITNQYEIHFVAGGLYKILIEWIDNGAEESDDEMAKIVSKLAKDNSKTK